jgi:serine/threonine protein kinase/Tol biopolymer transport system component
MIPHGTEPRIIRATSTTMSLSPGTRLGPYEILAPLGAGGMGEVYRARDARLGRDVAIKILPDAFVADAERLARFEREAQVLASLNHPHVAAIYGIEDAPSTDSAQAGRLRALVLELVEGPTLAEHLVRLKADTTGTGAVASVVSGFSRAGMPIDEVLAIARQIADALEAAHDQGIIHRDLKPANIKIRPDGTVKVLDFGLAKAFDTTSAGRPSSVSMSPTLTAATQFGVILGTAAYMAPEQARGKTVDKRADIWAFGCVLYEMLTGRRAFGGDEVSDTLAFVITKDIEWDALPPDTPSSIRRLLHRCLEKDPKRRLHDIADARLELDEPPDTRPTTHDQRQTTDDQRSTTTWWRRALPAVAVVVASALTGLAVWTVMRPAPAKPVSVQRYPITLPASASYVGEAGGELAVSPDGTRLVYPAVEAGKRLLYLRNLDQLDAQPIRGTDDAYNPFFSPDGEWIGFFTAGGSPNGKLKKVAVRGSPPLTLSDTSFPTGAWLADDTIVFSRPAAGGWTLFRMPAAGGVATQLTTPDAEKKESLHVWPEVLPGGHDILFTVSPGLSFDEAHIAVLSLGTGKYRTVIEQGYHPRYVSTGHLVYMLSGNLMAVPFDVNRQQTTGPPVPIVEGVRGRSATGEAGFAVSGTGFLIYAPGVTTTGGLRTLVWVDRNGREEPIGVPPRTYSLPRLSPDRTRVAVDIRDQENDIWIWDLARRNLTRLTFDPKLDVSPVWAPDGRRIFFGSQRAGVLPNVYWQAADGTGQAERLVESPNQQIPQAASPDGKRLLLRDANPKTGSDIVMLSIDDRRVTPLLHTTFAEQNPDISPDGHWIAYESNESGSNQISVRPFPDVAGGGWQVSTGGGTRPVWARSGRELFYVVSAEAVRMMAVPVQGGTTFSAGNPHVLFEGRYIATTVNNGRTYDVSADGQRFLMIKDRLNDVTTSAGPSFVFVLNWFDELKRLAPPKR